MVIRERSQIGELGLAYYVLGAWLVEEHEVHDATPPHHHSVLATEALVSNERVSATVIVIRIVVCPEVVLLFIVLANDM